MKYVFDTNIYQVWRNINDPAVQKISNHPTIQTIKKCFLEVEAGAQLVIPRIILTEHLVWIAKNEDIHKAAIDIGSRYGGLGAADLI